MNNKNMIIRECDNMNKTRRVKYGQVSCNEFFNTIQGDLLITGRLARNSKLMDTLIYSYFNKGDYPTIMLTSNKLVAKKVQNSISSEYKKMVITSYSENCNYMPFYGMSSQQIIKFISHVAEKIGYSGLLGKVMIYATAILDIVETQYPLSLPAITKLLEEDDEFISGFAIQVGMSNVVVDNIRANHEAGIVFRRICEYLESIFSGIYKSGCDSNYSLQIGVRSNISGMVVYVCSQNQELMNLYMKEELYCILNNAAKIRVILDEMPFVNENDELLKFLMSARLQDRIELIFVTQNVENVLNSISNLDFQNIIMFQHNTMASTDDVSKKIFGTYQYYYPVPGRSDTPHIFFSIKNSIHWEIHSDEKMRVCCKDLSAKKSIMGYTSDYMAVKTTFNDNIYLVSTEEFIPQMQLLTKESEVNT